MTEDGGGAEKITPLNTHRLARGPGEDLTKHKRRITLHIKDIQGELARNAVKLREAEEGVERWKGRLRISEEKRGQQVTPADIEKTIESDKEFLQRWERDKAWYEKYKATLDALLDDSTRYRRTLDAKPGTPETEK